MSLSRTPNRNESIRRREELKDARKVRNIIAALCAFAAFAFVGSLLIMSVR